MYTLLFVLNLPFAYLGDYKDLPTCQAAIREIFTHRINPPGERLKEFERTIDLQMKTSKEFICVKKS